MNILRTMLLVAISALLPSWCALGQRPAAPDEPLSAAVATAQKQYNDSFGSNPQLINGPEYVDYARRYHASIGHQYFLTPKKQPGSVYYNDHYFPNLQLAYDAVLDQVVLSPPSSSLTLRLINERVGYFLLDGHRFVRLVADSTAGGAVHTGYYEALVDGPVQVLARRSKRLQERVQNGAVDIEFIPTEKLFLKKDGAYYPISRKAAITRVLSDHRKEVEQFIKEKKLRFKKAQLEASVVQLARYYASLAPQ